MTSDESLKTWINDIAALIQANGEPEQKHYQYFLNEPNLALSLIQLLNEIDEASLEASEAYYSACVFALDICIAQIQAAIEQKSKLAQKVLEHVMSYLERVIAEHDHSLGFWLPILNIFYEAQVPLSEGLKEAYLDLAEQEEDWSETSEEDHLQSMRELILELQGLSDFEKAESFFAQTYAMPPEFFIELMTDLYEIDEGHEIALLMLLHPNVEVREMIVHILDKMLPQVTLSSCALTRLQTICAWYPASYQPLLERWIKEQRKKGVVFFHDTPQQPTSLRASEVDGSGAQGIFIEVKEKRKKRLCGLLFKHDAGIKDVWMTPPVSGKDVKRYEKEAFHEQITLREIDIDYLVLMTNHFLACSQAQGLVPNLNLLHIQEMLGLIFRPEKLDEHAILEDFAVQMTPFTEEIVQQSFKRSQLWPKSKEYTESWYEENSEVDKYVNRHCEIKQGVKACHFQEAMEDVFTYVFEKERAYWQFHFLWLGLWLKAKTRKNEKAWQDSCLIAYEIKKGLPLNAIPIMQEICYQTVMNSVETMNERRTHLLAEKK